MKLRNTTNFFETEYKQQAQNANFTKIGGLFGLKYTANKVAFTVLKKNITAFQKVEVISNTTALETLYMGGSTNIDGVIETMACTYVGTNNLSILETKGDFGSRLKPIAAASRYIFAKRSKYFDMLFNKDDLNILPRYEFEGQDIEYRFLTFNLPLLLINGSEGLGSGHAQKILPRNPKDTMNYIKTYLKSGKSSPLPVYYNGFKGTISQGETPKQWIIRGSFKRISHLNLEITEVPVNETYISYNKKLEKLVENGTIKSFVDLCDPKKDIFLFKVKHDIKFSKLSDEQIIEKLKLKQTITENYTIIDENNAVKVFQTADELIMHYIKIRLQYLTKRKEYLIAKSLNDINNLNSKYIFVKSIIENKLQINKRKKLQIIEDLKKIDGIISIDNSYDYLLRMPIYSLTEEKLQELQKQIDETKQILEKNKTITENQMWLDDLKEVKIS